MIESSKCKMEQTVINSVNKYKNSFVVFLCFSICILISASCSETRQIRPKPDNGSWIVCPGCRGYGRIESADAKAPTDIEGKNNSDERAKAFYAGCLASPFADNGDENKKLTYDDPEGNYQEMQKLSPQRSTVTRVTVCPRCNGKGWIKKISRPVKDS